MCLREVLRREGSRCVGSDSTSQQHSRAHRTDVMVLVSQGAMGGCLFTLYQGLSLWKVGGSEWRKVVCLHFTNVSVCGMVVSE